jgi:hypothetical protein
VQATESVAHRSLPFGVRIWLARSLRCTRIPAHVHTQQISIFGHAHGEQGYLAGKGFANFC